jgi:hypothetical protein
MVIGMVQYMVNIINNMKTENQKVTAYIPRELLYKAQDITKSGITETLKLGLEKVLHTRNYQELGELYGKYNSDLDLHKLREDR